MTARALNGGHTEPGTGANSGRESTSQRGTDNAGARCDVRSLRLELEEAQKPGGLRSLQAAKPPDRSRRNQEEGDRSRDPGRPPAQGGAPDAPSLPQQGARWAGEGCESSCAGHRSKGASTSCDCPWITGHEASASRPSTPRSPHVGWPPPGEGPGPCRTVNG